MANTVIRLRKSSVSGHSPINLEWGELALNYADGSLYYKDTANNIQRMKQGANSFTYMNVAGTMLVAGIPADVLSIQNGNNINIVADAIQNRYTIGANLDPVYVYATRAVNAAQSYANSTFVKKSGDTISGDLTITGNTYLNRVFASGTSGQPGQVLTSSGGPVYWSTIAGATDFYQSINANTALLGPGKYMIDTSNGVVIIVLPDYITSGQYVSFLDSAGDKTVNSAIIRCNTSTINGTSDDFYFDVPNVKVEIVFTGTTWKVFA